MRVSPLARITLIYTDMPDLSSTAQYDRFESAIELPSEALLVPDVRQRILDVALAAGALTRASLHVTSRAVGINGELIKVSDYDVSDYSSLIRRNSMTAKLAFYSQELLTTKTVTFIHPIPPKIVPVMKGGKRRANPRIQHQIDPSKYASPDEREFVQLYRNLADKILQLMNSSPRAKWRCEAFHPWYPDSQHVNVINRKNRQRERENAKRQKQAARPKSMPSNKLPHAETGAGRGRGAIRGKFMGVEMRSQLEIRLAAELEERGIEWIYEHERLGSGNYLVDFHLPKLKCWIEVKGKEEPRDRFLLAEVAAYLRDHRHEDLYMYTSRGASEITHDGVGPSFKHAEFWERLMDPMSRIRFFLEHRDNLEKRRVLKDERFNTLQFRAVYTSEGSLYEATEIDEEDWRSFLMDFRKFVQPTEAVYLPRVLKACLGSVCKL